MSEEKKVKKEKKPPYLDAEGRRRDPNRDGHPVLCNGMSRRTGQLCGNIAMKNGKCRVHGGKATGPKTAEGRKRISDAVKKKNFKTGEHVPIWFDQLSADEQELIELIPKDAAPLLEQEIMLTTVRERRMLTLIAELQQKAENGEYDTSYQESYKRQLVKDEHGQDIRIARPDGTVEKRAEMVMSSKLVTKDDPRRQLRDVEEALTRVQAHKWRLIELKYKLDEGDIKEQDGSLTQLVAIIGKARNLRVEQTAAH